MEIKSKTVNTYQASINLGLQRHYSDDLIPKEEVIQFIQDYQKSRLIKDKRLISVNIFKSSIVCIGQNEPHLVIQFIDYPKADLSHQDIKKEAVCLAKNLMHAYNQNRIVVVCTDETILLEKNDALDPRIS
jgi:hypothetical protein